MNTQVATTVTLGELIRWALEKASETYNLNVPRYLDIINNMEESKYPVSTFNEFRSCYDPLLQKTRSQLSHFEYTQLLNNKDMLRGMVLNIFNQVV